MPYIISRCVSVIRMPLSWWPGVGFISRMMVVVMPLLLLLLLRLS